jgi:tetratricopeptide (TPR) repeat protein
VEAEAQYQHLLAANRAQTPAHLGLARLAAERGDWTDSLTHLKPCLSSPFTRKGAHSLLAAIHEQRGDSLAAEQELRVAAGLPDDAAWPNPFAEDVSRFSVDRRSRLKRAAGLVDEGRILEGLAALQQLVRVFPDFDLAWRALGFALLQQGEYANAEQALAVALKLAPEAVEAQYYMGCALLNQGKLAAAGDHLRRATAIKPDYAMAHYHLGRCLALQGNRAAAVEAMRTAVRCRPYLAEAHRSLAELLAESGNRADALEHLRQAVELDPADQRARLLLQQLEQTGP